MLRRLPVQITREVEKLLALKAKISDNAPTSQKLVLKTAKGTRDFGPRQMMVRQYLTERGVGKYIEKSPQMDGFSIPNLILFPFFHSLSFSLRLDPY